MASRYTAPEKRDAIALAAEVGPAETGRRLGIPLGSLTNWTFKARRAAAEGSEWRNRSAPLLSS